MNRTAMKGLVNGFPDSVCSAISAVDKGVAAGQ
jgi:hypothetical protein